MCVSTLEFCNVYVPDERSKEPIQIPTTLERDTIELPVNRKRKLFVQTTDKRKTGSIRYDHSDILTTASVRETVKTMMNLNVSQYETDTLVGKVCAIFSCDRIASTKSHSVNYIKFEKHTVPRVRA